MAHVYILRIVLAFIIERFAPNPLSVDSDELMGELRGHFLDTFICCSFFGTGSSEEVNTRFSEPSSNSEQGCLHFSACSCIWERLDSISSPSGYR